MGRQLYMNAFSTIAQQGTAEISSSSSTSTSEEPLLLSANNGKTEPPTTNANTPRNTFDLTSSSSRPIVYQSPPIPPRRSPPELPPKPKPSYLPVVSPPTSESTSPRREISIESPSDGLSTPDSSSTNTICSLNFSIEAESRNAPSAISSDQVSLDSVSPSHVPNQSQEVKVTSPTASPRSPSKIPTPLPRKTISASNSSCSLASPTSPISSPGSPKFPVQSPTLQSPTKRVQPKLSEIPVPVKTSGISGSPVAMTPSSPPTSPTRSAPTSPSSADARRHTVVEVCEKVVVPRGQAQVTPFITVERYADEASGDTEVRIDEQHSTAFKKS